MKFISQPKLYVYSYQNVTATKFFFLFAPAHYYEQQKPVFDHFCPFTEYNGLHLETPILGFEAKPKK